MLDLEPRELERVLDLAAELKQDRAAGRHVDCSRSPAARRRCCSKSRRCGRGRRSRSPSASSVARSSNRRPTSRSAAAKRVEDVARNLERWLAGVVVRTFAQERLDRFATAAPRLHVVNALTDEEHPCQALADMLTLREHARLARRQHAGVRRRRQQRRGVARARRRDAGRARARRVAGRLRAAGSRSSKPRRTVARHGATIDVTNDPRAPSPAPTRSTPTCGRRWARKIRPTRARASSRRSR